jgi:hypothetical protein
MSSTINVEFQVAGTPVPIESFDITGSSDGSTGHVVAMTGMTQLAENGIDMVALSISSPSSVPVDVFVEIDDQLTQIFSGEFLSAGYKYNATSVSIHARDWSGPLVDQKRVLVSIGNSGALAPSQDQGSGISTQNKHVSDIVTAIANQFSLTPDLRISQGNDPFIGTIFGTSADTILTTTPQNLWAILNRLAKDTGNIVYTTPQKSLVFGPPGAGLPNIPITYMVNPIPVGSYGAESLDIDHNPRRNMTFNVVVLSYDPTKSALTTGHASVVGQNFSTGGGTTVNPGLWTGQQAQSVSSATSNTSATSSNTKIPIYTYHVDGLTQAQADQRAQAIAFDISKRELIAHVKTDCIPTVMPSNPATLAGLINQEFAAHQYFVTNYSHHFKMTPKSKVGTFHTELKLLDQQPIGAGASTSTQGSD